MFSPYLTILSSVWLFSCHVMLTVLSPYPTTLSAVLYSSVGLFHCPTTLSDCIIQLCKVVSLSCYTDRVFSHNTECCIIQLYRVVSLSCYTYSVISLSHNTECCTMQLCMVVSLSCYTYSVFFSYNTECCIIQICRVVSLSCYT